MDFSLIKKKEFLVQNCFNRIDAINDVESSFEWDCKVEE